MAALAGSVPAGLMRARSPATGSGSAQATRVPISSSFAQASRGAMHGPRRGARVGAVAEPMDTELEVPHQTPQALDHNQFMREGAGEFKLMRAQASKREPDQKDIATFLSPYTPDSSPTVADAAVIGCGPAGLALAAELATRGVSVVLVGMESKFTNNYGVWVDEFKDVGLEHTLDHQWPSSLCYFGLDKKDEFNIDRSYGRVARGKLREDLLKKCADAGVVFLAGEVVSIDAEMGSAWGEITCRNGDVLKSRMITVASGLVSGKFLKFEEGAPTVAAQTAYGIEAKVKDYEKVFNANNMLFMDYRRHHTGLYDGMGLEVKENNHPHGYNGMWGTEQEVPSFLYAMPLSNGNVFLEETVLVTRPEVPFSVLKRRLERRLRALGIEVEAVHDEEWSYIPVGGPLPIREQPITAFGAAANLVHPATGYSLSRSMKEAPRLAESMAEALKDSEATTGELSTQAWDTLWPLERQRQASFHVFGMELLTTLSAQGINDFFRAFFSLPNYFWRGFLGSNLSSLELIAFAGVFFIKASNSTRLQLIKHMLTSPSAVYAVRKYTQAIRDRIASSETD